MQQEQRRNVHIGWRIQTWYVLILIVVSVFLLRLFYLQIIRHNYYQSSALQGQLKEYEIPASRGVIEAHDGENVIPIVLNEKRYTLFADPLHIEDPAAAAKAVWEVIGGDQAAYIEQMQADSRYAVLAKKLDKGQKERLDALDIKGLGTREQEYRTYPQGRLAAQVLGFVNDEGEGTYGVEQALNDVLKGVPGQLRAITDAQGVPLVSNEDNIVIDPRPGERVVLTLDITMQKQLEDILKAGLTEAKSKSGSALIMDPHTGAIKAMANYPSYEPAEFYKVSDAAVFTNTAVSSPLEVGSIMKPLTVAAALNSGAVSENSSFHDPHTFIVDGLPISNVEEDGGIGTKSVSDILKFSLNTGATWLLKQMGGGEINEQARLRWHDYMTNHYRFGQLTGIEQGYETAGVIPSPTEGDALNHKFANTAFGQSMTATPIQMAAAISSVINGGTYHKPYLVEGREKVVQQNVVSPEVGKTVVKMMENVVRSNQYSYKVNYRPEFLMGGKTGTAQFARPEGGYYEDRFNGMFMGFVGGDTPEYVIVVRVNDPRIPGYAGSQAAAPIYGKVANMLIDNHGVEPKTNP